MEVHVDSYITGPDTPEVIIGGAALTILVSALGPRLELVRAMLQAALGICLLINAPTAALWALRPLQGHALDLMLLGIGLAALAALLGAAQDVALTCDLFSDPRSAAAGGLIVAGAAYGAVRWLVAELVIVVGLLIARLIAGRMHGVKPTYTFASIVVVLVLWATVVVLAEERADDILPLAVGAFGGCALAAGGVAIVTYIEGRHGAAFLPASGGAGIPLGVVLGAVVASRWESSAALILIFSIVVIAGALLGFAVVRFGSLPRA
jgi:hypothetical protein